MQPIRQLTLEEARPEAVRSFQVPDNLHVVVPAKNAAKTVKRTLGYLAHIGLRPEQVHLVVNNTTDDTYLLARESGLGTVYEQEEIIEAHAELVQKLESWGVPRSRLSGKGSAMFAATLALSQLGLNDTDPIVFIDVELTNLFQVDPVRRMLIAWERFGGPIGNVKLVKPSAIEDLDNWLHPSVAANPRYRNLAALRWILCGQIVIPWGALRRVRMASAYGIEIAMLMSLADQHRVPDCLAEVQLNAPIADDYVHPAKELDARYRMIFQIMTLMNACTQSGIMELDRDEIRTINRAATASYWDVRGHFLGPANVPVDVPLDAILPSLEELLETR